MKASVYTFRKLCLLMILVLGFGYSKAQDVNVNFDVNYPEHYGKFYLNQEQLDGINFVVTDSENWKVVYFTVTVTVKGFTIDATSNTGKITMQQRKLINQASTHGKIYFENIKIQNITTGDVIDVGTKVVVKDGICAKIDFNENNNYSDAYIRVYPSLDSPLSDTTRFAIKSFRVDMSCPQYAICKTFQGNFIDTLFCKILTENGFENCINKIVCIDKQTHEELVVDKIFNEHSLHYGTTGVYRSKEYFTKKNSKLDFIYKQDFKIDSVRVEFYNSLTNNEEEYTFKGDVFDETFKKYIRNSVPFYSWIKFYIYHSGGQCEGPISVYIVE